MNQHRTSLCTCFRDIRHAFCVSDKKNLHWPETHYLLRKTGYRSKLRFCSLAASSSHVYAEIKCEVQPIWNSEYLHAPISSSFQFGISQCKVRFGWHRKYKTGSMKSICPVGRGYRCMALDKGRDSIPKELGGQGGDQRKFLRQPRLPAGRYRTRSARFVAWPPLVCFRLD